MNAVSFVTRNEQQHLFFILYVFFFFIAFFYVVLNPEAGRDYHSYIRLINEIKEGLYLREFGFYLSVQGLSLLGLSPESIILFFRTIFFFLILRFFYYTSKKYKILGVVFFAFIPNIFIGSLNALQTWLAIAIFLQAFITITSNNNDFDKNFLRYSIVAFLFHYFALIYIILFLSYKYFNNYIKIFTLLLIIITYQFVELYIVDFLSAFGYFRYLYSDEAGSKFIILCVIFMVVYFVGILSTSDKKVKSLFFEFILAIFFFLFFVISFGISNEIALRSLNFFLPFVWLSLVVFLKSINNQLSLLISAIVIILLIMNFFINVDFNSDMLNLKGFKRV
jgi:hypothetical protein